VPGCDLRWLRFCTRGSLPARLPSRLSHRRMQSEYNGTPGLREQLWNFLEDPHSSLWVSCERHSPLLAPLGRASAQARIFSVFMMLLVVWSITVMMITTLPEYYVSSSPLRCFRAGSSVGEGRDFAGRRVGRAGTARRRSRWLCSLLNICCVSSRRTTASSS
jgi:hypothetical protein